MFNYYSYDTEVLAASIRNTMHIVKCIDVGADIVTCPLSVIEGLLRHPLTDSGLVKFVEDSKKIS